jgi:hypothetical protein
MSFDNNSILTKTIAEGVYCARLFSNLYTADNFCQDSDRHFFDSTHAPRLHPLPFFQDFLTISNFRFKTGKHLERASERTSERTNERTKYLRRPVSSNPLQRNGGGRTPCNAFDRFPQTCRALFQFSLCVFTTT